MTMVETKLKKWGNSCGLVVPKEVIDERGMRLNQTVRFFIVDDSSPILKKWFGVAKGKMKKTGQQIKDELRKELY